MTRRAAARPTAVACGNVVSRCSTRTWVDGSHLPRIGSWLDIGIWDQIARDLAQQGMAVLMICDEIPEAYYNSHRILVMRRGALVAEFLPQRCCEQDIAEVVNA